MIDGDTIDCTVALGFNVSIELRFRLASINAPELHTPEGAALLQRLKPVWEGVEVDILTHGKDRYGRWIADIFDKEHGNLSDWLLDLGLVEKYPKAEDADN